MKKGQAIQFNWIFVVIAGAIILALFLFFGVKYKELQIAKENAEIARNIDNIINGMVSTEQYNNLSLSQALNLKFKCKDFIVNNDYTQSLGIKIVFASEEINSKELFIWTKEVKLPFRIVNLVYLIDLDNKYYFDSDPLNLLDDVPRPIRSNFNLGGSYRDEDVFVFFNRPSSVVLNSLKDKKVIYFDVNGKFVKFYKNNKEAYFFDSSMIYGAIFSSDFSNYNCSFSRFIERYNVMRDIYRQKAIYLDKNTDCDYRNIRNLLSGDVDFSNLYIEELNSANSDLMSKGCEVVF